MRSLSLLLCLALGTASWIEDEQLQAETAKRVSNPPHKVVVNLDLPPKERWAHLAQDPLFVNYKVDFTNYVGQFVPKLLVPLISAVVKGMKKTMYPDLAEEMEGLAPALGVSMGEVVVANLIYQIENLGVSCDKRNTTGPCPPKQNGPGICSGLVANGRGDASDQVWQGRNLDWNLDAALLKYTLHVDYQRNNKTLFSAIQIAGEVGVLHGMRVGGYSAQINARKQGGNVLSNLLGELLMGHKPPSHAMRKAFETMPDFASAEKFLSTEKLANPVYYVMSGVSHGEGAILSRDRIKLVDAWHLFEKQPKDTALINVQPDWFRLQTNYDNWEAVPDYDNRRAPGVAHATQYCNATVDQSCVRKVMTTWPTQNHHTDVTTIMCAATGFMHTDVWTDQTGKIVV